MNARQMLEEGTSWTAEKARLALPIMLLLAKAGRRLTYQALDHEIARQNGQPTTPVVVGYGRVLEIIGRSLNQMSQEWYEEIPPLTILIVNGETGQPGEGVDPFLERYVSTSMREQLTVTNRLSMVERATNATHNYTRWDEVAAYFDVPIPDDLAESDPIALDPPSLRLGEESVKHLRLKEYVANHPEMFASLGQFDKGRTEYRLYSGDEVDVLFQNAEQTLAIEIKTEDAPTGELTRGIFQCVKYRAVLRAMHDVNGQLIHVQAVLVTSQQLPVSLLHAAKRLGVTWQRVQVRE